MNSGASDSRHSDARSRPSTGGASTMAIASTELVEREIRIDAPPSVVFEFLTDPAKMVRWMGTEAVLEPWPGGRYYVNPSGHEPASGKVLEIIPDRRLVFSWGWEGGALPLPPGQSTVEISLEPAGEGTRLRLTHRDLPPDMHSFAQLADTAANAKGPPACGCALDGRDLARARHGGASMPGALAGA